MVAVLLVVTVTVMAVGYALPWPINMILVFIVGVMFGRRHAEHNGTSEAAVTPAPPPGSIDFEKLIHYARTRRQEAEARHASRT